MGYLIYGPGTEYEFDDRVLAHLKIAIVAKLRLQESFLINWTVPSESGSGRMSLWMSPAVPLQFRFSGSKPPELNRIWLDALSRSSHGIRGMVVMGETEAADYLKAAGAPAAI
ncbi:MAG TPA: hypothetical protein VGC45_01855 [Gryllotalpicola sp.]